MLPVHYTQFTCPRCLHENLAHEYLISNIYQPDWLQYKCNNGHPIQSSEWVQINTNNMGIHYSYLCPRFRDVFETCNKYKDLSADMIPTHYVCPCNQISHPIDGNKSNLCLNHSPEEIMIALYSSGNGHQSTQYEYRKIRWLNNRIRYLDDISKFRTIKRVETIDAHFNNR